MVLNRGWSRLLALVCLAFAAGLARAEDIQGVQLHWDNDVWAKGGADRWHTNRMRLSKHVHAARRRARHGRPAGISNCSGVSACRSRTPNCGAGATQTHGTGLCRASCTRRPCEGLSSPAVSLAVTAPGRATAPSHFTGTGTPEQPPSGSTEAARCAAPDKTIHAPAAPRHRGTRCIRPAAPATRCHPHAPRSAHPQPAGRSWSRP